jgi:hypothetical protein
MINEKKVGIITLNWDGTSDTLLCLKSLEKLKYTNYSVLVVDNGSKSYEFRRLIKNKFNKTEILRLNSNTGFTGGNIAGYRYFVKKGVDYLVLLNNDMVVNRNFLNEVVSVANMNTKIGMVSPIVCYMKDRNIINTVGIKIYQDGSAFNENKGIDIKTIQHKIPYQNFGASGGAVLYKMEMLEKIGFLDNDFFAYLEDVDLAFRAKLAGWQSYVAPNSIVYHKHSASSNKIPYFKIYQIERNRIWVMINNYPLLWVVISPFFTLKRYFLSYLFVSKHKDRDTLTNGVGNPIKFIGAILRAHWDGYRYCYKSLYKRIKSGIGFSFYRKEFVWWFKKYGYKF